MTDLTDNIVEMVEMGYRDPKEIAEVLNCYTGTVRNVMWHHCGINCAQRYERIPNTEMREKTIKNGIERRRKEIASLEKLLADIAHQKRSRSHALR